MAEAIGIASGVAGLLSLTIQVIKISSIYINGVHGASSSVYRFLKELENLKAVLAEIDEMIKKTDDVQVFGVDGHSCLLSVQDGKHYLDLLVDIRNKLSTRAKDGSFRQKLKALTWPFSEERTNSLIESLHRHFNIYQTALAIDNLAVGKLTLKEVRQVRVDQEDSQLGTILDWLSPLNMYQKQQDIFSRRHGDTGSWLLSNDTFQRWVNSEGSDRTLWCPGDPGTGKTVITSIVVDYLVATHVSDDVRIAYVYCDYKDQAIQTASNLIACLARQLVGWPKRLPRQLERLYKELEPQRRKPSLGELRDLLTTLCNERRRTFVVVDALDECEAMQQRRHFLPLLKSLPHGSTRLFVTSRPNNEDIYHTFATAPQVQIAAPESDIQRFVAEKMEERNDLMDRVTPVLKDQIHSTVSARASGMFLLAVLQIDRICVARTIKKIKLALTSMPRELDDLYRETVERIRRQSGDDGELGMRVLSWVTHTKRPLHVEELAHGLAVEYDDDGVKDQLDTDNLLSSRSLVDVCAGLVVIDPRSQIIRLVHYTTQEYFDKERLQLFGDAEVDISMASLTYLSYEIADTLSNDEMVSDALSSHPFLTYASLFWFVHIEEIGKTAHSGLAMQRSLEYVNDHTKILFSAIIMRKLLLRPRTYARVFDDLNRERKGNLIALEAASECGLLPLVTFLLDHSVGSESALDSAINWSSAEGHTEVVTLLIERGASVHSLTRDSSNALQKACKRGHLGVANVLLQHGANVNISDRWMWTPLHHAAHGSHSGLVALLLENHANPNSQTPLGLTACHLAASRGDSETVRLLLDANYDLGLITRDRSTALHKAAEERRLDVCGLLLQRGSDVQAKNRDGQTALDIFQDSASPEVTGIFLPYMYAAGWPKTVPSLPTISTTAALDDQENPDDGIEHEQDHENSGVSFTQVESISVSSAQVQAKNADADIESEHTSKNTPEESEGFKKHSDSPVLSLVQIDDAIDPPKKPLPWEIPTLRLVEPSEPPASSSFSEAKGQDEQTHKQTITPAEQIYNEFSEPTYEDLTGTDRVIVQRTWRERDLRNEQIPPYTVWRKDRARDMSPNVDTDAEVDLISSSPIRRSLPRDPFTPHLYSIANARVPERSLHQAQFFRSRTGRRYSS